MRIVEPNYTQIPNDLFDHWLPLLGEVETKVLLVILRKTFGWHKQRDKISLSQMEKITGCHRSNIIKAVDSLQSKGLIIKDTVGINGFQETYYELVVDDSNNSTQSHGETPPSLDTRPPPVSPRDPQKKETLQEIKKHKETGSIGLFFSYSDERFVLLHEAGLDEASIKTLSTLQPSLEDIQTALACADYYKPENLGRYLYKAIQMNWKPPTKIKTKKSDKEDSEAARKQKMNSRRDRATELKQRCVDLPYEVKGTCLIVKTKNGDLPVWLDDDLCDEFLDNVTEKWNLHV